MNTWWNGPITQILYCIEYVPILDGRIASELAHSIIMRRCLVEGPETYLEAIDAALAQNETVRVLEISHQENALRQFLQGLAYELRRRYPWPAPPIIFLDRSNWAQLIGTTPALGRINLLQLDVSQRLGFEFGELDGRPEYGLLVRMNSGGIVGLSAPASLSEPGVTIFSSETADVRRIINEVGHALMLRPDELTSFAIPQPPQRPQPQLLPLLELPTSGVERWSGDRVERHRVVIDQEGLFRTIDGGYLDTRMASASWRPNAELALFIMDPHGNFYVSLRRVVSRIHHSTLSGGGPVAAAGELRVRNGRLMAVTDRSGHYPPDADSNRVIVSELRERGVNTTEVVFDFIGSR